MSSQCFFLNPHPSIASICFWNSIGAYLSAMEEVDQSNKENAPPLSAKSLIPPVAPSFKKKPRRRVKINRIPLADITNLFLHSPPPPLSIFPHSNSRLKSNAISDSIRRLRCSKSLRMGFR